MATEVKIVRNLRTILTSVATAFHKGRVIAQIEIERKEIKNITTQGNFVNPTEQQ